MKLLFISGWRGGYLFLLLIYCVRLIPPMRFVSNLSINQAVDLVPPFATRAPARRDHLNQYTLSPVESLFWCHHAYILQVR